MTLHLTDIEASSVKHALERYLQYLESSGGADRKAVGFEEEAVKRVIVKMQSLPGASGT